MGIRYRVRSGLVSAVQQLGIGEEIRERDRRKEEAARPDPFAVADIVHPAPITVLDIGASHGQFVREAVRFFPGATIYSFEPIPECYQELLALKNTVPTLQPMNLALGDSGGTADLWLSGFRDSSSLHEMLPEHVAAWPHTAIENKIIVQVARLDEVAPTLDLKPPIFAKIDVQGHEMAVIRGGRATLAKCDRVMLECNFAPLYAGQPTFNQLYDELRSMGFLFDGFISPLRHPQTLELLSSDAVFYKPLKSVESKSS